MAKYEKIPYSSFLWKFGTTSFRTREFNKKIEWQLGLLNEFWKIPENQNQGWAKRVQGQKDIYDIKNRYYDWLKMNGFTKGNDTVKYKAAREKTSPLCDMGFITEERRLTEVGYALLDIANNQNYLERNNLGISFDSQIYLQQLLKLSVTLNSSVDNTKVVVRPFIIVLYLLSELEYLSIDEFTYLTPLCIDESSTSYMLGSIRKLRKNKGDIDNIITDFLLSKANYQSGLKRFVSNNFSQELLLSVGMNRKSGKYDKKYIPFYNALHAVYMEDDKSKIVVLFESLSPENPPSPFIKWKQILFDTSKIDTVKSDPEGHLLRLPEDFISSEESFKSFFYKTMHLYRAKATLKDYLDLNRRYLGLTNCFLFDDSQIKLDIVPKQYFKSAMSELYKQAFVECDSLFKNCPIEQICPSLAFDKKKILTGLNVDLGEEISNFEDAKGKIDKLHYDRLDKIIRDKFSDEKLLDLLNYFENRKNDDKITDMVTDNADIPTIFEYVLGIIWYKASERTGKILDYLKLSIDANFMPITHARGGEADIVYEYDATSDYPEHSLLLEATLADKTNQRRMEMEPVSRHLGNHLLRTGNKNSYCVFAASYLNVNVISDFMNRKNAFYCDSQDPDNKYVEGMKIIPLSITDLKNIIKCKLKYSVLYKHFEIAHNNASGHPLTWYEKYVTVSCETAKSLLECSENGNKKCKIDFRIASPHKARCAKTLGKIIGKYRGAINRIGCKLRSVAGGYKHTTNDSSNQGATSQ